MTQISFIVNSMPRDLTEFVFFLVVGFTAGSMGLIWLSHIKLIRYLINYWIFIWSQTIQFIRLKVLIPQENQISISHWVQLVQQPLVSLKFSYHFY